MSNKKPLINLELDLSDGNTRVYTGRFLGVIRPDEFNAMVQNQEVMKKIETRPSEDFVSTFKNLSEIYGCRAVMTIRSINGTSVIGKKMFVSERLDTAAAVDPEKREVRLETMDDNDIYISEATT